MSVESESRFARDTAVRHAGENLWEAELQAGWGILGVPNGGYVMAMAARALAEALPHPHPLSITGYYVERTEPGPVSLQFEQVRIGNSVSTGVMRFVQDDVERARFMASYGDLAKLDGPELVTAGPPPIPPPQECVGGRTPMEISHRLDVRMPPERLGWMRGEAAGGDMELAGWIRLSEGGEPDPFSLLLFADGFPPAVFAHFGPTGWVPTLELTVHVRELPAPGDVLCRFRTRYLTNGQMEEDGELWDSRGRLVALSRQLARFRLPR